ncbi:hypothetical protein LTR53_010607 [Teratosphaeriaceae sp. CCFEE 6253]|nr:hypothetical protein LTR53_010607 [Teratosphaeriaceae sp. CCFEE 6253]
MDQLPRTTDTYSNIFADNQHYHSYDPSFLNGTDTNFQDASWNVQNGYEPGPSRAQTSTPSWPQNAHQPTTIGPTNTFPGHRSLSHSPAPFGQNAFNGYPPQQNFPSYQQPQYDPTLFNATYGNQQPQNLGTIAPQALQQDPRPNIPPGRVSAGANASIPVQQRVSNTSQRPGSAAIPTGTDNVYMSTVSFDRIVRATNSERMASYLNVSKDVQEWPINRPTALQAYIPRKSKNDLRKLVGNDQYLLDKIGKKSLKKTKLTALSGAQGAHLADRIKYEGETSSSKESDDDDASSYTSGEDLEDSPLPSKRPDSMKGGVEYDTIKALWRSKRRSLGSDDMRQAIGAFWEIVKTIRDRWKADLAALTEAETKNRQGELPLLRSRVKDQRDMTEAAFKAAHKHGHRSIVELLGQNQSLMFLCYQFLIDRFKQDDLNSPLPRAILELMSQFTTLSQSTIEKTHLEKVLPRYIKKGDAKTQYFAKRIVSNAVADVDATPIAAPEVKKPVSTTKTGTAPTTSGKGANPGAVAGVKRSASNAGEGAATKKLATATKTNGAASAANPTSVVKKPAVGSAAVKVVPAAAPLTKTKPTTAKPSIFSGLQSAGKKPGTSIKAGTPAQATGTKPAERKTAPAPVAAKFSFAETMANLAKPKEDKQASTKAEKQLPPESAEEKTKRLRKEARRKLHVSFKIGDELEQIRYFTHDPDEEMGHDDSQMRDVSDVGGEGRMLKLHADMMEVDDEEEKEVVAEKLISFTEPRPIDFSVIEEDERNRNYVQCGGKLKPESAERAVREQYEANTLIVFYADEKDIPPNPREPTDPSDSESTSSRQEFGTPEEKFAVRAMQNRAMRVQRQFEVAQRPPPDLATFSQFASHPQQPPPAPVPGSLDISKLLASLGPSIQQPQPQPPPMMGYPGMAPAPAPPMHQYQPPPPPPLGQTIDLSAILAAIGSQQQQAPPMAPGGYGPVGYQPQMGQPTMGGGQFDVGNDAWQHAREQRNYKTKVCKYWQEGKCQKGQACTYLHEELPA